MLEYVQGFLHQDIHADVARAVLGALGFASSIVTFVITNVMQRPAMTHWRILSWWTMLALWGGILPCVVDVMRPFTIFGVPNFGLKLGVLLWSIGILGLMAIINRVFFVHFQPKQSEKTSFMGLRFNHQFGITFLDRMLTKVRAQDEKKERFPIHFPILLIADRSTPGLKVAQNFALAGLAGEHEGVVYLTFTRPAATICQQFKRRVRHRWNQSFAKRLIIIDCYHMYSPFVRVRQWFSPWSKSSDGIRFTGADPRDPLAVQKAYRRSLQQLKQEGITHVRTVYDSFSDFISLADRELVIAYIRYMIVFEEESNIQALYLVWPDVLADPVSDSYLAWFSNTILRLKSDEGKCMADLENISFRALREVIGSELDLEDQRFEFDYFINNKVVADLARYIMCLDYQPISFDDAALFPPSNDPYIAANYFFFLTAIDHSAHQPNRLYEASIGRRTFRGSDLMYYLACRAQAQDRERFTAKRLQTITEEQVAVLFRGPSGQEIKDPGMRAFLLRDAAQKLIEKYNGDCLNLLEQAQSRLEHWDGSGLLQRLSEFQAYEDPLRKKSLLLVKLLRRRKLFKILDQGNLAVPVDNVLVTLALWSGLVSPKNTDVDKSLRIGRELDDVATMRIRLATREAFQRVSRASKVAPDILDDLLWGLGRELLRLDHNASLENIVEGELGKQISNKKDLILCLKILSGQHQHGHPNYPTLVLSRKYFY
jgi:hypothetical protein